MKLQVVIHEAEENGYWAEVPAIPGCATQGETIEELLQNIYEVRVGHGLHEEIHSAAIRANSRPAFCCRNYRMNPGYGQTQVKGSGAGNPVAASQPQNRNRKRRG